MSTCARESRSVKKIDTSRIWVRHARGATNSHDLQVMAEDELSFFGLSMVSLSTLHRANDTTTE